MVGRTETHDLGQQHPSGDGEEDEEDEACSRMWNILLAVGGCWEVMLRDQKGALFAGHQLVQPAPGAVSRHQILALGLCLARNTWWLRQPAGCPES